MIQTLRSIIGVYGLDILKDGNKLLAYYSDLAPMQKREHLMLEYLVKCDGHITLVNALFDTTDEQTRKMKQLVGQMVTQLLISEDTAETICQNFWEAIGGMPLVLKQPKPMPTGNDGSLNSQNSHTLSSDENAVHLEVNRYGSTAKSGGSSNADSGTITHTNWARPVAIIAAIVIGICIIAGGNSGKKSHGNNSAYSQSQQQPQPSQTQQQSAEPVETEPVETEPAEVALADLYARAWDSSFNYILRDDVMDSYGITYKSPNFQMTVFNQGEAYTELVAGGKYMYLSGTYFTDNAYHYDYDVTFQIYADGELVLDSGPINRDTKSEDFTVCINNADVVRLVAVGDENMGITSAIWLFLANAIVFN